MPKKSNTVIVVPYADYHSNSQVGLCHPRGIEREIGGHHYPSDVQKWLWECWEDFWGIIKAKKRKLKAKVVAVSLGDGADDNTHSSTGLINKTNDLIIRCAIEAQEPVIETADAIHYIAGTPAHVGKRAELEELVAMTMAARTMMVYKNPASERYISFRQLIRASGVLIDCAHRPISNSTRYHTKGGGAMRTAHELQAEYQSRNEEVPQIAFRAHVHHDADSGLNFKIRVLFCPPWTLQGTYALQRGFSISPIGGWYLICRDGEYRAVPKMYEPARDEAKEY